MAYTTRYYIGTNTVTRRERPIAHEPGIMYDVPPDGTWGEVELPNGAQVIDVRAVRVGSNPAAKHTVTWLREI